MVIDHYTHKFRLCFYPRLILNIKIMVQVFDVIWLSKSITYDNGISCANKVLLNIPSIHNTSLHNIYPLIAFAAIALPE